MKKIIIVKKELKEFSNYSNVIIKKNKTIIKNLDVIYNNIQNFENEKLSYKWLLEEWEVWNDQKIQLICGTDGSKLKSVHIISDLFLKNGVKALFQTEKMMIMKISNNIFELSKNIIDEAGEVDIEVIVVGKFQKFEDIIHQFKNQNNLKNFIPMIKSLDKNYNKYKEDGYLSPFYHKL